MKSVPLAATVLGLATVLLYAVTLGHGFVNYDDDVYVYANPALRDGLSWEGVTWAFQSWHAANWHPLTWLSHMLDVELFGLDAAGHHATNVLLHALTALLFFGCLRRMTRWPGASLWVALMFALHPMRVESVAWVAERKDLLAGLFWMLTLWFHVAWAQGGKRTSLVAMTVAFGLGLLAKPMLVTLPFVLLLLDLWPLARWGRVGVSRLLLEKAPLFVLAALSSWATLAAQEHGGAIARLEALTLGERMANSVAAYGIYAWKTFVPSGLAVFYPHPAIVDPEGFSFFGARTLVSAFGLLLVSLLALRLRSVWSGFLVGWLWFLGTLFPVIGIVQVGHQAWADRYSYLPTIGLFWIVGFGLARLVAAGRLPARPIAALGALAVVASAGATWAQLGHWKDGLSLWRRALAVTSDNYLAHYNLGLALEESGRPQEAVGHYGEALRIHSGYADAHYAQGLLLLKTGELGRAEQALSRALQVNPRLAAALGSLGLVQRRRGDESRAIAYYREALELEPELVETRNNLGSALLSQGDLAGAERELLRVLEDAPDYVQTHLNLGLVYTRSERPQRAVERFRHAFRLEAPPPRAAHELARLLLGPGRGPQEKAEALRWADYAVREDGGRDATFLSTLAACHAAVGDRARAVEWGTRALEAAPAHQKDAFRARLEGY